MTVQWLGPDPSRASQPRTYGEGQFGRLGTVDRLAAQRGAVPGNDDLRDALRRVRSEMRAVVAADEAAFGLFRKCLAIFGCPGRQCGGDRKQSRKGGTTECPHPSLAISAAPTPPRLHLNHNHSAMQGARQACVVVGGGRKDPFAATAPGWISPADMISLAPSSTEIGRSTTSRRGR